MSYIGSMTSNPAGSPKITPAPAQPGPPSPDVVIQQDAGHSESDFLRDLDKVTQQVKRPD